MRVTIVGLFLLLSTASAWADDWLNALTLFDAGQYEEALELLTPIAESGNLEAMEFVYASYTYGYGVPVDHGKAVAWLRRGAEQGDPKFQEALGQHYYGGIGVPQDYVEAMRWMRLAAQQGHASAIYNVGIMTMNGQGIEADVAEGWRLIQWAGELDQPDALFLMAGVAMQNAVAEGSIDTAMGYMLRAAQLGQRQASAMLGVILEDFPEDPDYQLKSALHYRVAVAAGCDDVKEAADRAVARLSTEELAILDANLALWLRETDPRDPRPAPGRCLAG